jgi:hypothetical protein
MNQVSAQTARGLFAVKPTGSRLWWRRLHAGCLGSGVGGNRFEEDVGSSWEWVNDGCQPESVIHIC